MQKLHNVDFAMVLLLSNMACLVQQACLLETYATIAMSREDKAVYIKEGEFRMLLQQI
jgi:hypothetical protein